MKNDYQLGSDDDWLKHSNEELALMVKKRDRKIRGLKMLIAVLLLALGWILFRFLQKHSPEELWRF